MDDELARVFVENLLTAFRLPEEEESKEKIAMNIRHRYNLDEPLREQIKNFIIDSVNQSLANQADVPKVRSCDRYV